MDSKASDDDVDVIVSPSPSALEGDGRIALPAKITADVVVVARKARRLPEASRPSPWADDARADDDDDEIRPPRVRLRPLDLDDDDVNAKAADVDVASRKVAVEMILRVIVSSTFWMLCASAPTRAEGQK